MVEITIITGIQTFLLADIGKYGARRCAAVVSGAAIRQGSTSRDAVEVARAS